MSAIQGNDDTIASLITGCTKMERSSQKLFYAHFYGYAYTVCHRYVAQEEDMIEVINDGFLKIFQEIHHFQAHFESVENSLKAWIRRIFINTAIDHVRKQKNRVLFMHDQAETLEDIAIPASGLERLSHKELLEMITKLSPAYRMVFNLFVIDGYSHEEISEMLNIAIGTSKSNLAKARLNLQKMIVNKQTQLVIHGQRAI